MTTSQNPAKAVEPLPSWPASLGIALVWGVVVYVVVSVLFNRLLWVDRLADLAGIGVAAFLILGRALMHTPTREEAAVWDREAPQRAQRLRELAEERERAAWNYRCPECKMQIHRDARICPYCRSRFE